MYLQAVVWTVLAWFAGLILDANLSIQPAGFLCLRVLLPMLSMGLCILREIRRNGQSARRGFSAVVFYAQISVKSEAQRGHIMRRLAKR